MDTVRATPGFLVSCLCSPKILESKGSFTISSIVAALMMKGKDRLGSFTKSSGRPSAIMRVASASWS